MNYEPTERERRDRLRGALFGPPDLADWDTDQIQSLIDRHAALRAAHEALIARIEWIKEILGTTQKHP